MQQCWVVTGWTGHPRGASHSSRLCDKNKPPRDWTLLPGKTPTPCAEEAPDRPPGRLGRWRSESYSGSSDLSGFTVRRRTRDVQKALFIQLFFFNRHPNLQKQEHLNQKPVRRGSAEAPHTTVPSKHTAVCTRLRSRPKENNTKLGFKEKNEQKNSVTSRIK